LIDFGKDHPGDIGVPACVFYHCGAEDVPLVSSVSATRQAGACV
jgi:hypothetical protein